MKYPRNLPPKSLRFERLTSEHIAEVLKVEAACNAAPWSEQSFKNELDHEHGLFLVAKVNAEIVGYAALWLLVDEAHITNVAIKPEARRQGIARTLLIELLNQARKAGMTCATLEVRASNEPALKLYAGLGFVEAAVRKGYYPDNREDAKVLWLYDLTGWDPSRYPAP